MPGYQIGGTTDRALPGDDTAALPDTANVNAVGGVERSAETHYFFLRLSHGTSDWCAAEAAVMHSEAVV